jgi:hypothetical protein
MRLGLEQNGTLGVSFGALPVVLSEIDIVGAAPKLLSRGQCERRLIPERPVNSPRVHLKIAIAGDGIVRVTIVGTHAFLSRLLRPGGKAR